MVWVCPPHTSMNLNSSSPARSVMDRTSARAAAGSRNSSTNFIVLTPVLGDLGRPERVHLVGVVAAHLDDLVEGQLGLLLVDQRHGEAHVDQHPVADLEPLLGEQPDADLASHPADVDGG